MNTSTFLRFAAVAATAASAFAQTSTVLPVEFDRGWGRGSSTVLGGNSTRTQMIFAQPFAAGTVVNGVGVRPTARTTDSASFTADIEIRMSSTTAMPGALSATFATNVGSDEVVVFPRQMVTVPAMPANRSTGMFLELNFPTGFTFGANGNTNICVEVLVYGRSTGASWSTDRGFASANGRAVNVGMGCGTGSSGSSTTGGTYVAGSTVALNLTGATANSFALLIPSFDMKEFTPGLPLPFPLSNAGGAPGCDLLVNPNFGNVGMATDANGDATVSFTVPAGVGEVSTGWQWVYFVPPTPGVLPLATTNNRFIKIGPETLVPNAQYVWDLSNVASTTGNNTTDSCPVVKFIF